MMTVGDGVVTVLGMVWVEVVGVAKGVMDTVLVMVGMVTLLLDDEEPAAGGLVAPTGELSVVAVTGLLGADSLTADDCTEEAVGVATDSPAEPVPEEAP